MCQKTEKGFWPKRPNWFFVIHVIADNVNTNLEAKKHAADNFRSVRTPVYQFYVSIY